MIYVEALVVMLLCAVSCALVGVFLSLRGQAMIADAMSHTVLLGIVLAFFWTKDLDSPLLLIAAALFGVLTVFCIESIQRRFRLKSDTAIGLIFPFFFSIAVLLISVYARNVHLDTDMVLMGEILFTPLKRSHVLSLNVPSTMVTFVIILAINIVFISLFYKELKVGSFDPLYAKVIGLSSPFIYYGFLSVVSMTTVASFDAVGALLVVAFLIAPSATAIMWTSKLHRVFSLSIFIALAVTTFGYWFALQLNVNPSGSVATFFGIVFVISLFISPQGLITRIMHRMHLTNRYREGAVLAHIANHSGMIDEKEELGLSSMIDHVALKKYRFNRVISSLVRQGYVFKDEESQVYCITDSGKEYNTFLQKSHGILEELECL